MDIQFQVHYGKYNKRFGSDGIHEPLSWETSAEAVEKFKQERVFDEIISTEVKEKSMMDWMANLPIHTFEVKWPN